MTSDVATAGFRDPGHLCGWLHDRREAPDAKNTVLRVLLAMATGEGPRSTLAVELLILALWPGLTTIRRRLRPISGADIQTLEADLVGRLSLGIRGARVDRVQRVAATLLRNTDRDLRRDLILEQAARLRAAELGAVAHGLEASVAQEDDRLVARMMMTLGEDGALLAAVHLCGWSQKDAAECLGISHDAARKRCQRAIARLKTMSG
ncbi:sigma-70 family RNA polymerase sigma factor [Meridianimarinicoccus sp. MJW13]|uniref:sigma-70 family RNA polymerase sigma factor n=1 Tax=Meridianimarinicoccus sp. MJW13 TaxID=2720031 RepID=UPI0018681555|nr:sigma-70 family RNA polymerase sigma factor [Fluviibacterium sp. MJW13]